MPEEQIEQKEEKTEEAEEYADKDFGMYEPTDHERYAKETDWKDGAEVGYNKTKEEHKQDELGLIISNSSARAELEKQLEQAEEIIKAFLLMAKVEH